MSKYCEIEKEKNELLNKIESFIENLPTNDNRACYDCHNVSMSFMLFRELVNTYFFNNIELIENA